MNKRTVLASLNKIANELDNSGLHNEANTITKVMVKLAYDEDEFENDIETIAPQSVSKSSTSVGGSPSDTGEVPMGKSEDTVVG